MIQLGINYSKICR